MEIKAVFFSKWLLCLVLYSFCALAIVHRSSVPPIHQNNSATKTTNSNSPSSTIAIAHRNKLSTGKNSSLQITQSNFSKPLAGNYTIPVVVHIINQNPDAVTDQQIIDAIKELNDAFAHTGVYAVGPGANTGITFCLAKINPDGGITNGITRTKSVLGDFDQDIENDKLKDLVSWDTKQYCNIWYVEGIKSEIYPKFSCSQWSRLHEDGYAGSIPDGDYRDGIVAVSFGPLLAHEMGHYLRLKHIFEGGCANIDCSTNGDGICDTPPQAAYGGSCITPQNTCSSDTLSGFSVDLPDLTANFMGYSGACANQFTAGQGAVMRNTIDNARNSLTQQNKCNPPCGENILAKFTRDNWLPTTGTNINFTSTSTGGTNYQWSIDGAVAGTNSPNFSHNFPSAGKYKVTLKVYNANQNCYASYSDFVIVSCGVMARFYPDKRSIAAADPFMVDSVYFTNRSVNAASYKWLLGNNKGMAEQVVSTQTNLNYVFKIPANYSIRLIATNGGCSDTTQPFNLLVGDATPDGRMNFYSVTCLQETKIKVSFSICNNGYAYFPSNIPVSFYDGDPASGNATKIGSTFFIPDTILGRCCTRVYDDTVDVGRSGVTKLYAVFNDDGSTKPLNLPNTKQLESNYANNITSDTTFRFKVSPMPPSASLEPGDTLQLSAKAGPGNATSLLWSTAENLTCTNCNNPLFIAGKKDATKMVKAASEFGCTDSAVVNIKITPADDYTIKIDSVTCGKNDSMLVNFTVCNNFKRPVIPKDLKIAFYDGDPANATTHLLGPVFIADADHVGQCNSYRHIVRGITTGDVFAIVNDNGIKIPVQLPADSIFLEKDYTNNLSSITYQQDTVSLTPSDTIVSANQSFPIIITSPVYNPSTTQWIPGDGYALSCTNCSSPIVKVKSNATAVNMQTENQYGCVIHGQSRIKILSPDMTIHISQTNCYSNDSLLVRFELCMNNQYDSVLANIPVSFYETDPSTGKANLLGPVFVTPNATLGNCDSFSTIIKSPSTQNLFAVVNDPGNSTAVFDETNFSNNGDHQNVMPFVVTVTPADTTALRPAPIQLIATVTGGEAKSITWDPLQYLSCTTCLTPVATPPHSIQFKVEARNEYGCIATGYANIKTYTGGNVNIPNGFTPNADGKNDVFYVMGNNEIKVLKDFSIFNRWGQKIFQVNNAPANDPGFGWNGFFNGKEAETGTYVYFVNILFNDGTVQLYKGTVTLIR